LSVLPVLPRHRPAMTKLSENFRKTRSSASWGGVSVGVRLGVWGGDVRTADNVIIAETTVRSPGVDRTR